MTGCMSTTLKKTLRRVLKWKQRTTQLMWWFGWVGVKWGCHPTPFLWTWSQNACCHLPDRHFGNCSEALKQYPVCRKALYILARFSVCSQSQNYSTMAHNQFARVHCHRRLTLWQSRPESSTMARDQFSRVHCCRRLDLSQSRCESFGLSFVEHSRGESLLYVPSQYLDIESRFGEVNNTWMSCVRQLTSGLANWGSMWRQRVNILSSLIFCIHCGFNIFLFT